VKFFLDTADIAEIEEAASWGVLSGVTTNPTLYSRVGGTLADFPAHIKRICDVVDGPVSAETVGLTRDEIVREGIELAALAENVVVKVPTMVEGLAATRSLSEQGIKINMTLCFTVPQAILAARSGAAYVSPFVGRFDDISEDGVAQLADVVVALGNYDFGHDVEVIAASIRSANHVTQSALMGADIATVPFSVLKNLVKHPLTDRGLESFLADWEKVKNA
jgi:transaldolase